jgi:hypothetical protein
MHLVEPLALGKKVHDLGFSEAASDAAVERQANNLLLREAGAREQRPDRFR